MDQIDQWWTSFVESFFAFLRLAGDFMPTLGAMVAIIVFGWITASIAHGILIRSGYAVGRTLGQFGRSPAAARTQTSERVIVLVAKLGYWMVILVFVAIAARVAGLDAFSNWLDRIVNYLPTLVAGVLIALAGYFLGALVRDVVSAALQSTGTPEYKLAGLAAQATVFTTALVIGLDQIGIDITFLIILISIVAGGVLLSFALAFAMGAKDFVGNLIAAHQLRGVVEPGDQTRIGAVEGRVLEVSPTAIVLINDKGRVHVPAALLQKQYLEIATGDSDE
jgi:hypothetical protein